MIRNIDVGVLLEEIGEGDCAEYFGLYTQDEVDEKLDEVRGELQEEIEDLENKLEQALGNE